MNNFMKLLAIFAVFIQIQIALSQKPAQSAPVPNLIQQLCKQNRYQNLCISTLNLDPRSKSSNLQGLATISIDATKKKVNETLQYLLSVFRTIGGDREKFEIYGTCIDQDYGAAFDRLLPAALADLKAKRYAQAMSTLRDVASRPEDCEAQFAGKSPMTARNKAVHDIADMTADIIKTIVN